MGNNSFKCHFSKVYKIFIYFKLSIDPLKTLSKGDGKCDRCKKKYESNSEVVIVESKRFSNLVKGYSNKTNFEEANNELEALENKVYDDTNSENKYFTFHLECWKKQSKVLKEIYSKGLNEDYSLSGSNYSYKEESDLLDDFGSRLHHFSDEM